MTRTRLMLLIGAALPLAACGADDIASPGEGGVIVIPAPTPTPSTPTPTTPTPTAGTPAADCPTGTTNAGTEGAFRLCRLSNLITDNYTVARRAGTAYLIDGKVDVGVDVSGAATPSASGDPAVLTIDAGALLVANSTDATIDYLVINRGSRIQAQGRADLPIIFTARQNLITGGVTENTLGLWGGVVLAGRAPVSNCNVTGVAGGAGNCQNVVEGTGDTTGGAVLYGGEVAGDNSGIFQYVQLRYSGIQIGPVAGNELQGLTLAGTGLGTTIDHVQVHNSGDDGIEVFGGRTNARYLVITGAEDDALDTDVGHQGAFQFVLAVQGTASTESDPRGFEIDSDANEDALPRTDFRISNFTLVQRLGSPSIANSAAIHLRGGTDARLANGVVVHSANSCLNLQAAQTVRGADAGLQDNGPPTFNSIYFACTLAANASAASTATYYDDGNVTAAQIAALVEAAGTNNVINGTAANALSGIFITTGAAAAVPVFNASALNFAGQSFLVATNYIGAVRDANDTWYRGWACDSAIANFGTGNNCTVVPTL